MKKDFEIKPVKHSVLPRKTLVKALSLSLTVGTLSCPGAVIGLPALTHINFQQSLQLIDADSSVVIPGLQVAVFLGDEKITQQMTDINGFALLNFTIDEYLYPSDGIFELRIQDVDGSTNGLYTEKIQEIEKSPETITIQMTKASS
jgi:hypothetical protein